MHLEFLVEDASGKIMLDLIMSKLVGESNENFTYSVRKYKGIGSIPRNLKAKTNASKRILLDQLPRLLQGFGKQFKNYDGAVIVVVDLDGKDKNEFVKELNDLLDQCKPAPQTVFGVAVEEMEAWLLGDRAAVYKAYPKAKSKILTKYQQDSICGTWEVLANAIHTGGAKALKTAGWPKSGIAKCDWARTIGQYLDVETNQSPSFQQFRDDVRKLLS